MPRRDNRNAGLQAIAAECGVSHMTVSRILGGKGHLHKAATVKKVKEVAERLGYRTNILARSMKAGKSYTVGVVMASVGGSWVGKLQKGIHDGLMHANYLPITLAISPDLDTKDQEQLLHQMLDRQVDGFVFFGCENAALIHLALDSGKPVVGIDNIVCDIPPDANYDHVGMDEVKGATLAAEHLLLLGHRSAGVLRGHHYPTIVQRCETFASVFERGGGKVIAQLDKPRVMQPELPDTVMDFLEKHNPSCLFCADDRIAAVAIQSTHRLGRCVPEDLSVVGHADLDFARCLTPALTTVRQDPAAMGREAASLLIQRIEGPASDVQRSILLTPRLIVRASTAQAKGR